jgi:hypothetical protein
VKNTTGQKKKHPGHRSEKHHRSDKQKPLPVQKAPPV